jgi:hypothetical protein
VTIDVYCFEDGEGNEFGCFTTQNYDEAKQFASEHKLRIICRHFEYSDWEPLDDYTHTSSPEGEEDEDDDE